MTRKHSMFAAVFALAMVTFGASSQGFAQSASTLVVKDGTGSTQSLGTVDCRSSVKCYVHGEIDTSGTQVDPATKGLQQSILSALGSPFQAGGSIGNIAFGASQSGAWNITNISGTISLPTGAATSANQTSANTKLDTLHTDLSTGPIALPTGASTAANQATGNASLASIATNTGPSGNDISVTPTIQNAAYVSGNCMGGFQPITFASASALSQIGLLSKGGLTTSKVIYLFNANPASSTCTDKGTFTVAPADVAKEMLVVTLTPATTTGTTVTSAFSSGLALGIPTNQTIYEAIVETASETPGSTTDLVLKANGL